MTAPDISGFPPSFVEGELRQELLQLTSPAIIQLLQDATSEDPVSFALRYHARRTELPVRAMTEQLACRQKAQKKLPALCKHNLLYTTEGLEQASGERAAAYKSTLMHGRHLFDMTGGLGIDTIFLANRFARSWYSERDPKLAAVMSYNLAKCGIKSVEVHHGESIRYLESFPDNSFDWIMVDPDRREKQHRTITLQEASPDVVAIQELLLRKSHNICIKASPVLETSALKTLLPALHSILVVSVDHRCRELLLLLNRDTAAEHPVTIKAVVLTSPDGLFEITGETGAERTVTTVQEYLFEPDPAIIKARLSATLALQFGCSFINESVDYLTGSQDLPSFPGRRFRVNDSFRYKEKKIRNEIRNRNIRGASIQRRDFPADVATMRKKLQLHEDKRNFLFFTKDASGALICIHAIRELP